MSTQTQNASDTAWRPGDTLAARLILTRHALNLSQREASIRTGVTYGEWQSMENGRQARGVDVKVSKIANALHVDRDWLMWGGSLGTGSDATTSGWSGGNSAVVDTLVAA